MSTEEQSLTRPSADVLALIARASTDEHADVEKMERLAAMYERLLAEEHRIMYIGSMRRVQARCPQIERHGRIVVKGVVRSRYAKLEDIDSAIRPLLDAEGFAVSFDSEPVDGGKKYLIIGHVSHVAGHRETKSILLPVDTSEFRSATQCVSSTISVGRRQLIKMHFNIVEQGEDTDGVSLEKITPEQIKDIETILVDTGGSLAGFLKYMHVDALEDILARDYAERGVPMLNRKKQQGGER